MNKNQMKNTLTLLAAAMLGLATANAQTNNRGYNVYNQNGSTTQIIPNPLGGGGWNVYHPNGSTTQVYPNPIGGGYTILSPNGSLTQVYPR
jgi:hypothetical protein